MGLEHSEKGHDNAGANLDVGENVQYCVAKDTGTGPTREEKCESMDRMILFQG